MTDMKEIPGDKDLNLPERIAERSFVNKFLKAHWPAISTMGGAAFYFLLPSIQAYINSHPKTAVGVLLTCIVGAFYKQSPFNQGANGNASN